MAYVITRIFCRYFDITPKGNWEEKNIPRIKKPLNDFATENNLDIAEFTSLIKSGKQKLLQKRAERIRPALDDKILLGWNALMNIAYCKAYAATGIEHYKDVAEGNINFLLTAYQSGSELLQHTWKNEQAKQILHLISICGLQ